MAGRVARLDCRAPSRHIGIALLETTAYLSLGANLGDRLANLQASKAALRGHPLISLTNQSALYETAPVGGPAEQPHYLNGVVQIQTSLTAQQLLDVTSRVEAALGRQRATRNGPRMIDIDILTWNDDTIESPGLRIPHPRLHGRLFVLVPFNDVAPNQLIVTRNQTVRELLAANMRSVGEGDFNALVRPFACADEW